jgi:hypothetical protein
MLKGRNPYSSKMETVNNNNDTIVSENNMIIVQHSKAEVIDTAKCKRVL